MGTLRFWLETIYFISAPLLLIVAVIGLKQLKIARDTIKISSRRDALKLATSECERYLSQIIPLHNKLNDAIKKLGIASLENAEVTLSASSVCVNWNPTKQDRERLRAITTELLDVCNAMESFSAFFVTKVADEGAAFSVVGRTFCDSVEYLAPLLIEHWEIGYHKSISRLFFIWQSRLNSEKLVTEKRKIEDKINKVHCEEFTPFGTED